MSKSMCHIMAPFGSNTSMGLCKDPDPGDGGYVPAPLAIVVLARNLYGSEVPKF